MWKYTALPALLVIVSLRPGDAAYGAVISGTPASEEIQGSLQDLDGARRSPLRPLRPQRLSADAGNRPLRACNRAVTGDRQPGRHDQRDPHLPGSGEDRRPRAHRGRGALPPDPTSGQTKEVDSMTATR
jgi:hypothetical protein